MIRFEESFRLHAAMAEFLRQEIYRQDGIHFHSKRRDALPARAHADAFVAAVLDPACPLVLVVHDEAASTKRNDFERRLIAPVLEALADAEQYGLDPVEGLGVVVPHRAQRAALRSCPSLTRVDPETGQRALGGGHGGTFPGRRARGDCGQRHRERPRVPVDQQRVPAGPAAADGGDEAIRN